MLSRVPNLNCIRDPRSSESRADDLQVAGLPPPAAGPGGCQVTELTPSPSRMHCGHRDCNSGCHTSIISHSTTSTVCGSSSSSFNFKSVNGILLTVTGHRVTELELSLQCRLSDSLRPSDRPSDRLWQPQAELGPVRPWHSVTVGPADSDGPATHRRGNQATELLSVLKSHFARACIGLFKQLYPLCERRFVHTFEC
jgi:hypothetical protein